MAIVLHILCGPGLAAAYFLAQDVYAWSLVTYAAQILSLLLIIEAPILIGAYCWVRRNPEHCSYWKAAGRGLLALPIGALLNAFRAIVLGAPFGVKPTESVDYMISLPAHGAVLGAWPMPLDWERPWQEWPICVTYGAIAGYLVGLLASSVFIVIGRRSVRVEGD